MVGVQVKGNCFCCNIMYVDLYYSNLSCTMVPVQPESEAYVLSRFGIVKTSCRIRSGNRLLYSAHNAEISNVHS